MLNQRKIKGNNAWLTPFFQDQEAPAKKRCLQSDHDKLHSSTIVNTKDATHEQPSTQLIKEILSENWLDKFAPTNVSDLAVSAKKLQELQDWIKNYFGGRSKNNMLLLTGPSGCGKTAAVNVVAKHMGVEISEWVTPIDIEYTRELNATSYTYYEKQSDKFADFLLKSSCYPSLLCSENSSRIVLVEDFPNIFLKEPSEFFEILQKYQDRGKSPLIFICSDSNNGTLNIAWNLFSPTTKDKYNIDHISFNPITNTNMKTALKRISTMMNKKYRSVYEIPNQDCIDGIVNSSMGDIISAVNNLHYSSLKGSLPVQVKNSKKKKTIVSKKGKKKGDDLSTLQTVGKDENITIMHGVGRVLNPKLQEKNDSNQRDSFSHSPVDLAEQFQTQPVSFVGYIHENYLPHFSSIEHVEKAVHALSEADFLMNEWREKDSKLYGLLVAISGVMIANKSPVSSWHPIKSAKSTKIIPLSSQEIPMLERNQLFQGKVLATDFKSYCEIIKKCNLNVTKLDENIEDSLIEWDD